ncbi:ubiquitin carboxyl-terminal hydrolase family protein [Phlyctema vagabunda]|uniref:ubiquitinyl hydrolase 1 n=1 Tax=Phlyctema vagabunda TaxID=108571 RepID=A0ABR4PR53_9HELO
MPATKAGTGTINRFLSRREKDGSSHSRQKSRDKSSDGRKTRPITSDSIISLLKPDPQKKLDKEQAAKVESIQKRLNDEGFTGVEDSHIQYTLASKHAEGNVDKAFEMLVLFQESVEGVIKPYDPAIHMYGAENREGVTCYLDSLLFAMFARLGSFEPILYATFEDEPRRRLSTLIRLWVNMLRTGKLIQTDITQHLQDALAACGWKEAADIAQQDTSEAFSFITAQLELPLLTLKMDIYHTGLEDDKDDHKFIHERLLEVAVPEDNKDGRPVQLEDCLEEYFNNRIEVVRRLERSNTLTSVKSAYIPDPEKAGLMQDGEVTELEWSSPNTPISANNTVTPIIPSPTLRHRSESIIRHRVIQEEEDEVGEASTPIDSKSRTESAPGLLRQSSVRKGAVRKEVLMPAWQFFNLIPWYTKESPANDAEVAAHFSQTRPVLGICLKRYFIDMSGKARKRNTYIDIPLDIRLPHFVPDELKPDDGPLMGNFKLSLQSVICHRGNDVNSGHYISFIRGTSSADGDSTSSRRLSTSSRPPIYAEERWIKFDDCATPRVVPYDIEKALKEETPYLLFYQVIPTYNAMPPEPEAEPPSYTDSGISMTIDQSSPLPNEQQSLPNQPGYFDGIREDREETDRFSTDLTRSIRNSLNLPEDRRGSIATEATVVSSLRTDGLSAPVTPSEETTAQRMSRAAARFTKSGSKSRPTSQSGENRISATFSRLALMRSKESLNKVSTVKDFTMTSTEMAVPRKSNSLEENIERPPDATPTKKGKSHKWDKSKNSMDKQEREHHHATRGRGKDKDDPDRECMVM